MSKLENILSGYTGAALDKFNALNQERGDKARERMNICHHCDTYNNNTKKCDKSKGGCGCFMPKKVYATKAKCPKKKW